MKRSGCFAREERPVEFGFDDGRVFAGGLWADGSVWPGQYLRR